MTNEFDIPVPSTVPSSFSTVTSIIKVEKVDGVLIKFLITWPAQASATGYEVSGSFNPFHSNNPLHPGVLPSAQLTFQYELPITPPTDVVPLFWVRTVRAGPVKTLIQDEGASIIGQYDPFLDANNPLSDGYGKCTVDNLYMRYTATEMRSRTRTILENDGEQFDLYYRRWGGNSCTCTVPATSPSLVDKVDPDLTADPSYQGVDRCLNCFGTGIIGGYYPKVSLLLRYRDLPPRKITFKEMSIDVEHDFNSLALWLPKLHEHDLLVRNSTKERFVATAPKQSEFRGLPMHQELNVLHIQDGDIRQLVTNASIATANALNTVFSIFV